MRSLYATRQKNACTSFSRTRYAENLSNRDLRAGHTLKRLKKVESKVEKSLSFHDPTKRLNLVGRVLCIKTGS